MFNEFTFKKWGIHPKYSEQKLQQHWFGLRETLMNTFFIGTVCFLSLYSMKKSIRWKIKRCSFRYPWIPWMAWVAAPINDGDQVNRMGTDTVQRWWNVQMDAWYSENWDGKKYLEFCISFYDEIRHENDPVWDGISYWHVCCYLGWISISCTEPLCQVVYDEDQRRLARWNLKRVPVLHEEGCWFDQEKVRET